MVNIKIIPILIFNLKMEDWTEKYRPKSLDEIVGNEKAVIELRKWASTWSNGSQRNKAIILSGKPGTGKTSSAIALAKDFGWTPIELNTSDARNAQKIKQLFYLVNQVLVKQVVLLLLQKILVGHKLN